MGAPSTCASHDLQASDRHRPDPHRLAFQRADAGGDGASQRPGKLGPGARWHAVRTLPQGDAHSRQFEHLTILDPRHSFDGNGRLLRLGLQAYALGIAYEFDPYFGLSISRVENFLNRRRGMADSLYALSKT